MLKNLSEIPDEQLKTAGYTSKQIKEIKDYKESYAKHIESLSTLEDSVLTKFGYTNFVVEISQGTNVYYDMTSGERASSQLATAKYPGSQTGVSNTSGMGYEIPLRPLNTNNFAMNGQDFFQLRSVSKAATDFYYYVAYGHTVLTVSVGFDISSSEKYPFEVDFKAGMNTEDFKEGRVIPRTS